MLVSLIILLLLVLGFRYGLKRGLAQTLVSLIGYVLVLLVALYFSSPLGDFLAKYMPSLEQSQGQQAAGGGITGIFYKILAFWIVALLAGIALRILNRSVLSITKLPVISQFNALAGGLIWLLATYVIIFFGLLLLASSELDQIKLSLENSQVAEFILQETPLFSSQLVQYWQEMR